jgi:hypothetical protein
MNDFNVAVIATTYWEKSHTDVIVSRWLEPRPDDVAFGWPKPCTRIASMYVDEYPDNDMSRDMCKKHNVSLYDNVADAVRGADAVLLIGEHGEYPENEIGQKLYPRKELFDKIVAAFKEHGRAVPVFCDKFLSWNFDWAIEMDRTASDMGFILFSSSSIPLCKRVPEVDLARQQRIDESVSIFFGGDEAYGYHSFEFVQAIIERRAGGETGVKAITVYLDDEVWKQLEAGRWSTELMDAALEAIANENPAKLTEGDMRKNCDNQNDEGPTAICIEYIDGMRMTHLNLSGHSGAWSIAMRIEGRDQPLATAPTVDDATHFYAHFATMSNMIEQAFLANKPPFAPQRSLMTTGLTALMMQARANPGVRLETPQLAINY